MGWPVSGDFQQSVGRKVKTQPVRTCLGCHERYPKDQLLKFVLQEGKVIHDSRGTGTGRSAYCCDNENCLRSFSKDKRKLSRAFRARDCHISVELEDRIKE